MVSILSDAGSAILKGVLLHKQRMAEQVDRRHDVKLFARTLREDREGFSRVGTLELRGDNYFVPLEEEYHISRREEDLCCRW